MSTDQDEIAQVLKKEMDQGLGDSLTDENTEAIKSFRSLLKKYQNLVIEYHNHNIESKRYIEMILDKNNRLREINKKLEHENMILKGKINSMARKLEALDCLEWETGCLKTRGVKINKNENSGGFPVNCSNLRDQ
ncbi:hypothetical protein TpMuguga_03g00600 [Theileria parva strain Muguga]|uniref:Uncharacterized protein n=1 Tax=Theileria parva TaxID=5875 RepID=Q4MZC3_THEPA|nr:uncharacterized protein TpMuguga_03g00600 [Theileria parva strain Muguga]EAN31345.1 hypothetical protein TpMuguga_03g00600 [Theileria parva strain Muguga]|eukprot:XP_763628.1 hypothetical protein [Theileria parva strain Muguga]